MQAVVRAHLDKETVPAAEEALDDRAWRRAKLSGRDIPASGLPEAIDPHAGTGPLAGRKSRRRRGAYCIALMTLGSTGFGTLFR